MQDSPQFNAIVRDFHSEERTDPNLELANKCDTSRIASTSTAAASIANIHMATSDSPLSSAPPGIVEQINQVHADVTMNDSNVTLGRACAHNPHQDSLDQDAALFDIGATQKSELKSRVLSKQKRTSASSSKSESLHNKKRTFSLKEHMKESDPHPSDEETAHSFKWLTLKRPQHFSIVEVENQPPLPTPKFTFVDLMNAAPHLAATVQRNVAISLASDMLHRKGSETKTNTNLSIKMNSGSNLSSNSAKSRSAKNETAGTHASKIEERSAAMPSHGTSEHQNSLLASHPSNDKLDPHLPTTKKRRSKFSSASSMNHLPSMPLSNAGTSSGPSIRDRAVPRAPASSVVNTALSKKLVRSATHVYIANYISEMRKAQESLKKIREKEQVLLRQQQEQRVQQSRQQQQLQQQMHNQQQMMQLFHRSQQGQTIQPQESFLSHSGAAVRPPFSSAPPPTSSPKTSSQRSKSSSQSASLLSGAGSYSNPNLSYLMMPPSGQRSYASAPASHMTMGYPSSAYSAQAQAQYHNQYLAMQQLTHMNSMNQHHFAHPSTPSRNSSQTAGGLPFASLGYPSAPFMFGPSQGLPSGVAMASGPHADFNASRQLNLEQMKLFQQNEKKSLQSHLQSHLIQQVLTPPEHSVRLAKLSPRISPNALQGPSSSSGSQLTSVSDHQAMKVNDDPKSPQ